MRDMMNKKMLKQLQKIGLTTEEAAEVLDRLSRAAKGAAKSVSALISYVELVKKKHGLTQR